MFFVFVCIWFCGILTMNLVFVSLQSLLNRINIYVRKFIDQLEFHDGNTERNSDDKDFDGIRHEKATHNSTRSSAFDWAPFGWLKIEEAYGKCNKISIECIEIIKWIKWWLIFYYAARLFIFRVCFANLNRPEKTNHSIVWKAKRGKKSTQISNRQNRTIIFLLLSFDFARLLKSERKSSLGIQNEILFEARNRVNWNGKCKLCTLSEK